MSSIGAYFFRLIYAKYVQFLPFLVYQIFFDVRPFSTLESIYFLNRFIQVSGC